MMATTLADLLGVSRQAVSQYENNIQTPSPDVMVRIVEVLGFPMHYFLRPMPKEEPGVVFYRSMSSATKTERLRAERRYRWLREIVGYLHQYVEFPSVKFPDFDVPPDPAQITDEQVERTASDVRRFWGLGDGPISNVAWLLENHGAVMARHELSTDTLDAFSEWNPTDAAPYFILGTDKLSAARSRFDAAHELAHMVLHRRVPKTALNHPATFKLIETQANRFANALLLPESTFSSEFYGVSLDALRALKSKWRVSIAAMIMRAAQIRLIDAEQQRRLMINLTRRGWRTREPLDDTLEPEEPRFLKRSFDLLLKNRLISAEQLELQLGLRVGDIEKAAGLPTGYFGVEQDQPKLRTQSPSWPKSADGNWLLFPKDQAN